jgi:hypothetical protein
MASLTVAVDQRASKSVVTELDETITNINEFGTVEPISGTL